MVYRRILASQSEKVQFMHMKIYVRKEIIPVSIEIQGTTIMWQI